MSHYVALLRGINVSGKNRIGMDALRALFSALGHSNVTTYIQSGNVVFETSRRGAAKLTGEIEHRIASELGVEVTVLLRSKDELEQVIAGNPFLSQARDPSKLHVTFLAGRPDPALAATTEALDAASDELRVREREVYLHCPGGYGRTKLNNAFLERRLEVAATTRNWKTVKTLFELAGG